MKFFLLLLISLNLSASIQNINVLDKKTMLPVSGAIISNGSEKKYSDNFGNVSINNKEHKLFVRAYGYKQQTLPLGDNIALLEPFKSKALYISFWAAGSDKYVNKILHLAKTTEINSVIVDIKNEFGNLSYKTDIPLAKEIGAHRRRTIRDIDKFIKRLKDADLYVIGRIIVFKDNKLAHAKKQYALKDANGTIWRNKEQISWVNPLEPKVYKYICDIAADAASHGFNEINFDYVRFPLKKGLVYKEKLNQKNRIAAISSFLRMANSRLLPYNVFISVDTYGYVCWNKHDTNIGHTITALSEHCDYIAPMLYPSGFNAGALGYKNPTDYSYEIINASLLQAIKKSGISPSRFKPWLQSFKDYGFDRKYFRSKELSEQIKGAEDALSSGWMLWNPSSKFSAKGLQDSANPYPILLKSNNDIRNCSQVGYKPQKNIIP